MRGDRRYWYVTVVATLVALVLTGGVLGAIAVGPAPAEDRTVRAAGDAVSGVAPDMPVTTSTPAPVSTTIPAPLTTVPPATSSTPPTTRRPATTVTTQPAVVSSGPVVRSTSASSGMKTPGAVELPFSPGRTSWSAVSNGVAIAVRVDNASPKAGDTISFEFELSSAAHRCCNGIWVAFGDGYSYSDQFSSSCPSGGLPSGGSSRFSTSHIYNLSGRWTFAV